MAQAEQPPQDGPGSRARWSADRLAVALEEVGFDVGRTFPLLRGEVGCAGTPVVELGRVSGEVADRLRTVLMYAATHGVAAGEDGVRPQERQPAGAA